MVTLNRPERLNAWTARMGLELWKALIDLDAEDDVRAIVVTGAGRAFCAGADMESGAGTFGNGRTDGLDELRSELGADADRSLWELSTPIIAAINGHAVGVGLTVTLNFDIRIVAEDAKLAFPFSRRGVLPEMGSSWILPRLIGVSNTMNLMLTGRTFSGQEAARIGLASQAVPAGQVLAVALEIGRDLAANTAPASVGAIKRMVYDFLGRDRIQAKRLETSCSGGPRAWPTAAKAPPPTWKSAPRAGP